MDVLGNLQAGIDQAGSVLARIPTTSYDKATPCPDWNVGQLANHMVGGLSMFRDVGNTGQVDPSMFERDLVGADGPAALANAGREAIAAWSGPGKLDGTANLPFGEYPATFALQLPAMDMLVHSWDLARAEGLDVDWDPDLVANTTEFVTQMLADPNNRGHDFGPPVTVSDDADPMDRLVAFLGRHPV